MIDLRNIERAARAQAMRVRAKVIRDAPHGCETPHATGGTQPPLPGFRRQAAALPPIKAPSHLSYVVRDLTWPVISAMVAVM
jgi:hypothetical protein